MFNVAVKPANTSNKAETEAAYKWELRRERKLFPGWRAGKTRDSGPVLKEMSNDYTGVLCFTAMTSPHVTLISLRRTVRKKAGRFKQRMPPPWLLSHSTCTGEIRMWISSGSPLTGIFWRCKIATSTKIIYWSYTVVCCTMTSGQWWTAYTCPGGPIRLQGSRGIPIA